MYTSVAVRPRGESASTFFYVRVPPSPPHSTPSTFRGPEKRSRVGLIGAACYSGKMAGQDGKWQKEGSDQNFDYMFKLLIIGNSSVGKTSFLFRYADDSFTSAFVSTVGIDFKVKTVFRHDKRVKLQIWVSPGRQRVRRRDVAIRRARTHTSLVDDEGERKNPLR